MKVKELIKYLIDFHPDTKVILDVDENIVDLDGGFLYSDPKTGEQKIILYSQDEI